MAGYEVFHVLPKWRFLVTRPMQTSGTTAGQAIAWLAASGAVYNCHRYAASGVLQTHTSGHHAFCLSCHLTQAITPRLQALL